MLFVTVLLVSHWIKPRCFAQTNNQVCHDTAIIRPMPVGGACRSPDQISCLDGAGLITLVANPTGASHHLQELPLFVGVPVCPSTWSESNVGDGSLVVHMDHVEINIARECGGGFGGALASLGGASDND